MSLGAGADHPSPQLRTRDGTIVNMTRLGGMALPLQSFSSRRYFSWKRSMSARRSGPSDRNSIRPWTTTPRISPLPETASATTDTRESRRRLRTFCVSATLIMVRLVGPCRNHIGMARGAPSACRVASTATSFVARNPWMRESPSSIPDRPLVGRHLPGRDAGLAHGRDLLGGFDRHVAAVAGERHELIARGDHLQRVGGGAVVDAGGLAVALARLDDLQLRFHDRRIGLVEARLAAHREREVRRAYVDR